ncbi:MAG: acyl-CoA dehydrogenase family protein [Candidatus Melainabacteria bacterium]
MLLTDVQQSIRVLAREFAERTLRPVSKTLENGDLDTIRHVWAKLGEAGLTALPYPEDIGGAGVDSLAYTIALEELAKVSAGVATSFSVHSTLVGIPLLRHASPAQVERYIPAMMEARIIGAFGLTEPNAGSDAGSCQCRAEKRGDTYVIHGSKIFITNALTAGVFIITARTDTNTTGAKGLSAFLVDRDTPGLTITKGDDKMGLLGSDWGELHFDACAIPAENRLGEEGQGFKLFMQSLDTGRISIAAISVGLAEACLEAARDYASQREQFGKPLSAFQAIRFKLADMATEIEAARCLVYNAARLKEAGQPYGMEASMAKLYASEMVNRCASEAVQVFGGYGYTKDFPVERYFRDARVMSLFEGTSQIQQLVIARHLIG